MKFLRFILLPFSWIYLLVTKIRNTLYDSGFFKSFELDISSIAIGNLTAGGTGKSPMVEYIICLLKNDYNIATLSRGYKRKTRGLRIADHHDNALTIGDEPAQFLKNHGNEIIVAVSEDRLYAIPHILIDHSDTDVILLDDAFQQRQIIPSSNILLSDYNRPFYNDYILPYGFLRESRVNAERADLVIVTKCPSYIEEVEMAAIITRIRRYVPDPTPVYFTFIEYEEPLSISDKKELMSENVILVTGIADPVPLINRVSKKYNLVKHFKFPDHHYFSPKEIEDIVSYYKSLKSNKISILFTEKDVVRITNTPISDILIDIPVFFQPITYKFAKNGLEFDSYIKSIIQSLKKH